MANRVEAENQIAVQEFLKRVVVPILHETRPDQVQQIGSGFFFARDDDLFLVTARHLFEDFPADSFLVPDDPIRGDVLRLSFEINYPTDPAIDIAVLKLTEADVIAKLRSVWTIMDDRNTGIASNQGVFVLCGFAASQQTIGAHGVGGSFNAIYTERTKSIPHNAKPPIDPTLDFFLHYDPEAEALDGTTVATPDLPGFSGSAIWEYREVEGLWTPARALRIVGLQAAWLGGEYARGKAWPYAAEIIRKA